MSTLDEDPPSTQSSRAGSRSEKKPFSQKYATRDEMIDRLSRRTDRSKAAYNAKRYDDMFQNSDDDDDEKGRLPVLDQSGRRAKVKPPPDDDDDNDDVKRIIQTYGNEKPGEESGKKAQKPKSEPVDDEIYWRNYEKQAAQPKKNRADPRPRASGTLTYTDDDVNGRRPSLVEYDQDGDPIPRYKRTNITDVLKYLDKANSFKWGSAQGGDFPPPGGRLPESYGAGLPKDAADTREVQIGLRRLRPIPNSRIQSQAGKKQPTINVSVNVVNDRGPGEYRARGKSEPPPPTRGIADDPNDEAGDPDEYLDGFIDRYQRSKYKLNGL